MPDWHSDRGIAALDWLIDDLRRVPYVPEHKIGEYLQVTRARLDGHSHDLPEHRDAVTPAELEVLHGYSLGGTAETIAAARGTSLHTVKCHTRSARAKLGVHSTAHACCVALRQGLIV